METPSPPPRPFTQGRYQSFLADLGHLHFKCRACDSGEELLLQVAQPPLLVLSDQLADVLAGRAPVTGIDLVLDGGFGVSWAFFEGDVYLVAYYGLGLLDGSGGKLQDGRGVDADCG